MNRRDFLTLLALVVPGTALPARRVFPADTPPLHPSSDAPPPACPMAIGGTLAPSPAPAVVCCGLGTNSRGRLRYVLSASGRVQAQRLS